MITDRLQGGIGYTRIDCDHRGARKWHWVHQNRLWQQRGYKMRLGTWHRVHQNSLTTERLQDGAWYTIIDCDHRVLKSVTERLQEGAGFTRTECDHKVLKWHSSNSLRASILHLIFLIDTCHAPFTGHYTLCYVKRPGPCLPTGCTAFLCIAYHFSPSDNYPWPRYGL